MESRISSPYFIGEEIIRTADMGETFLNHIDAEENEIKKLLCIGLIHR